MSRHILLCCSLSLLATSLLSASENATANRAPLCQQEEQDTTAMLACYETNYPDISYQELRQLLATGKIILIDANRWETYASGHLPGAISIHNKEDLGTHLKTQKNMIVVAYCGGSQCIAWHTAADLAANKGFKTIRHFSAGLRGWQLEGGEVFAINGETNKQ